MCFGMRFAIRNSKRDGERRLQKKSDEVSWQWWKGGISFTDDRPAKKGDDYIPVMAIRRWRQASSLTGFDLGPKIAMTEGIR